MQLGNYKEIAARRYNEYPPGHPLGQPLRIKHLKLNMQRVREDREVYEDMRGEPTYQEDMPVGDIF